MLLLTFLCSIRYWPVLEAAHWILQSSNVICYDKSCEFFWGSGKLLCILHRLCLWVWCHVCFSTSCFIVETFSSLTEKLLWGGQDVYITLSASMNAAERVEVFRGKHQGQVERGIQTNEECIARATCYMTAGTPFIR